MSDKYEHLNLKYASHTNEDLCRVSDAYPENVLAAELAHRLRNLENLPAHQEALEEARTALAEVARLKKALHP